MKTIETRLSPAFTNTYWEQSPSNPERSRSHLATLLKQIRSFHRDGEVGLLLLYTHVSENLKVAPSL